MKDFYTIAGLIRKFRTRTISEDEVHELRVWFNERGNRELFNRLMEGKREVDVMHELRKYNSGDAYRKFSCRTQAKKRSIGYYTRVAAVIALPLVLGILAHWWILTTERVEVPVAANISFLPGEKKAVLTLDDGTKMALGDAIEEEVVSGEGVSLKIDSTGLIYKVESTRENAKMNELYVPRKGEYNLTLSDGTRVYLNSDSKLIYPVTFGREKREVILQGEGYFDVAKDEARPFLVKTNDITVRVLGTSFNLKSYPEDALTETTLVQGSVAVLESGKEMLLVPGEQARFDRKSGQLDKARVNTALFTSWKNGLFVFERERLEDILTVLGRWYDVTIFYQRHSVKDELFTGDLKKYDGINEHLKMLEMTTDVHFEIHGNTIIVR